MEPPSQGIFRYFPLKMAHFFTPPLPFPTSLRNSWAGGSAEDARKVHDLIRQLGRRHRQKETRPAWLEADAQGRDHRGRINDGELGKGTSEHTAMKALKLFCMLEVRDPKGVMTQIDHHRHLTIGKAAFLAGRR